jgi:HAD superfamily hydrolase (TIGR01509 family)
MDLLIFDFDGLILDTETASYKVWSDIFQSYGATLPITEWATCIGTTQGAFDVYTYLQSQVQQPIDVKEIARHHRDESLKIIDALEPRPGVLSYMSEAQKLRLPLALASSSDQNWVMRNLSRLNLAEHFHSIRTSNDVERVKPDPELYQLTLTTMGVKPHRAIAFEDSPNGIKAAKAAGIFTVAVPNSVTRQLPIEDADLRIESMADISLRELLHQIQMSQK